MSKKGRPNFLHQLGIWPLSNSASFHAISASCIAFSQETSSLIRSFVLESSVLAKQERNFYGQLAYVKSQQQIGLLKFQVVLRDIPKEEF